MAQTANEKAARNTIGVEACSALKDARNPRGNAWEITTPPGWRFVEGRHTWIEHTKAQADRVKRDEPIEPCPVDCDCEEAGEVA